jgi:trimeric autotransporter adhesin
VLNGGASTTVSVVVTPTSAGTLGNSGTVIVAGSTFTASANASLGVASYSLAVQPSSETVTAGNPATFNSVTLSTLGSSGTYTASISLACPSGLPNGVSCTFSTTPVTLQGQSPSSVTLTMTTTARTTTSAATRPPGITYAMWLPIGGLTLFGVGLGGTFSRKRRVVGGLLVLLLMTLIALQPACSHSSSSKINAGTPAGTYAITVSATSGTFSQTQLVQLVVQ